jgi:hypothetical protein
MADHVRSERLVKTNSRSLMGFNGCWQAPMTQFPCHTTLILRRPQQKTGREECKPVGKK